MDYFNNRYYWLFRKLLLLIGQWPYNNQPSRVQRIGVVVIVAISLVGPQIAKISTSQCNIHLIAEMISNELLIVICMTKHANFIIQRGKIKMLLDKMKNDWMTLTDDIDRKIARSAAETGRKYILFCSSYIYAGIVAMAIVIGSQPLIDTLYPINETRIRITLYPAEYFVDQDKYFYPILLHMTFNFLILITVLLATDTMFIACLYHACGMFQIVGYRLEHIFDEFQKEHDETHNEKTEISTRIASAVEYHKNATKFAENIISAFGIMHMLLLIPLLVNISISLYCTALSMGNMKEMMTPLAVTTAQLTHLIIVIYPCQKLADYSATVSFKVYCGQWYTAPHKLQTLLLPIIQRGGRPSHIIAGKMVPMTVESYATVIQTSLSYFTVLLSFKTT